LDITDQNNGDNDEGKEILTENTFLLENKEGDVVLTY
jgi:hypothetical protein